MSDSKHPREGCNVDSIRQTIVRWTWGNICGVSNAHTSPPPPQKKLGMFQWNRKTICKTVHLWSIFQFHKKVHNLGSFRFAKNCLPNWWLAPSHKNMVVVLLLLLLLLLLLVACCTLLLLVACCLLYVVVACWWFYVVGSLVSYFCFISGGFQPPTDINTAWA